MTLLKICGMRSMADLECCRGADYLGFVVLSDSPRCLDLDAAAGLMSCCDRPRVAVTTETRPPLLRKMLRALEPDVLQLHSPLDRGVVESVRDLGVPLWGMVTVRHGLKMERKALSSLQALVLDSPGPRAGGSGQVHDWTISAGLCREVAPLLTVLAGGLRPENVRQAIDTVRPFAVDVSSGVEGKGGKDPSRVSEMMAVVRGEED
ncbi:MAG: phosphoribosylanthranilate isomerase [Methanomassiliicoccales archaeon]|nr:phosphoribosylanthranilate isomerase [Methanomassiliicoccales archaeon]